MIEKLKAMLSADGAVINEADVAWIVDTLAADLAAGYDGDPAVYREHVHDVIGALIGRGIDPSALRRAMEQAK